MGKTRVARAVGGVSRLNELLKKSNVTYVDLKLGKTQDGAGQWRDVWVLVYEEDDNVEI